MTDTQVSSDAAEASAPATVPLRFEVAVLPVADVDRAKAFYQRLGWRLDADFPIDEHFRIVQFTPPGSPASIQFGTGTSTLAPGSIKDMYLIVDDIEAARDELISRGADVSEIWHGRGLGTEGISRARTRAPVVRQLRLVQRPRRQPLPAAGDHRAASGEGVTDGCRGARRAPARDADPPRRLRGGRPAARLVGLVRRLHGRPPGREPLRGGHRIRRALHGRGQARRRPATDAPPCRSGSDEVAGLEALAQRVVRGRAGMWRRPSPTSPRATGAWRSTRYSSGRRSRPGTEGRRAVLVNLEPRRVRSGAGGEPGLLPGVTASWSSACVPPWRMRSL